MKNQIIRALFMFVSLLFITITSISPVDAAIKLTSIEGKKFIDYEITDQSRKRSLIIIERDLVKLFEKVSSKYLTENELMEIDITYLDLPGWIYYAAGPQNQDIRVVRSDEPYKLYFNYRIKDAAGSIIKEGEQKIKEYSDSGISRRNQNNRGTVGDYEYPLKKWFKATFTK